MHRLTRFLVSIAARVKVHGRLTHLLPNRLMHIGRNTGSSIIFCNNVQVRESGEPQAAILLMKREKVNCFN